MSINESMAAVADDNGDDQRDFLARIREKLGPSRNREHAREKKKQKMTNKRRLTIVAPSVLADILEPDKGPQHPDRYVDLTGDETGYQIAVAVGAGIHGKGLNLAKTADGEIEATHDNAVDLLSLVGPKALADLMAERGWTEEKFVELLAALPE